MKHRIISILTALALCLSLCPAWAFAEEGAAGPPEGALAAVVLPNGNTTYPTDEAEFRAVFKNNDTAGAETTVTLLDTVTLAGYAIQIWYGTFILDLNGKSINFTGYGWFSVNYDLVDPENSGGSLTICGSGTVHSETTYAVQVSKKGTVTLAGGTFSTGMEDQASVYAQGTSALNVIGPDVKIERLYAASAAQVSLAAGTYNRIETSSAQKPLSALLGENCAYYRNGNPIPLADLEGQTTLPGPVTVDMCSGPGDDVPFQDDGNGEHSRTCPYCGGKEIYDCTYGGYTFDDENDSHVQTCPDCGSTKTEAHQWRTEAECSGSVTTHYQQCYICKHTKDPFTVTVTVPDGLVYGQTKGKQPTCTVEPEKEYTHLDWSLYKIVDTDSSVFVLIDPDGTLPAVPAGDYQLRVEGINVGSEGVATVFHGAAEFNVAPAQLPDVFTLDETQEYIYNGNPHTPTVTAEGLTENVDYTVEYANNTGAGKAAVTITGIGDYTGTVTKEFTIKKAVPNITTPSAELFYGQKLSHIKATAITGASVPGSWTWANPNEQPLESNGLYSAAFTPGDTANYESVPDVLVEVIVSADAPEITLSVPDLQQAGKDVEITYTVKNKYDPNLEDVPKVTLSYEIGTEAEQTLEEGITSFTIPDGTAPNTTVTVYAITQPVSGKYSYKSQSADVAVTDKIPVTITGVTAPGKVYDGQPYSLTGTPSAGDYDKGFSVRYSGADGTEYEEPPANAGSYLVCITLADEENYIAKPLWLDFSITPAPVTVTAENKTVTKGDAKPALTYKTNPTGVNLGFTPSLDCAYTPESAAGEYPITITGEEVSADGNYTITYVGGKLTVSAPTPPRPSTPSTPPAPVEPPVDPVDPPVDPVDPPVDPVDPPVDPVDPPVDPVDPPVDPVDPPVDPVDPPVDPVDPPVDPVDPNKTETKLEITEGISEVPPALKELEHLNTPEKVEQAMQTALTQTGAAAGSHVTYDVELLVSADGGQTWTAATKDNFPADGLTVTLPYPAGTDSTFLFTVVHMFTTSDFGKTPGDTETPAVTNTEDGIQFTVTGLSPISVGWKNPSEPDTPPAPVTPPAPSTPSRPSGGGGSRPSSKPAASPATAAPATPATPVNPAPEPTNGFCDGGADCPSRAYADLRTGSWYHEAVDYAIREGLLTGYGDGTFRPNGELSRAMLAQILYNMEGRPSVSGGSSFLDVAPGAWYANAVTWAAAQGIAGGYGNGRFGPNDSVTREQLAVMLWRYNHSPAATDKELHFSDADRASSWALEALRWAAENGIIKGKGGGVLDPQGPATRAQAAQMLKNLLSEQ